MIDLSAKPFYLNDEQTAWVNETFSNMSVDDKIKQLFIDMAAPVPEQAIKAIVAERKLGGLRYMNKDSKSIAALLDAYKKASAIPPIIAANTEAGGNGACSDGTEVGCETKVAATDDIKFASAMGEISAKEAKAVGCNTLFAPIVDINRNWRNPIIATRTFGADEKKVAAYSLAYMQAAHSQGVACVCKHFPGDGIDERDQHLANSVNSLSQKEWDSTFGYVYKSMIDGGVEGVMVGHIMLPAYEEERDKNGSCLPASLSRELLEGLLRGKLGFNGLIITDASHMVGLTGRMSRSELVPRSIAAGCDMFLFYNDYAEDFEYVKDGIKRGILTHERLDAAVMRILAFKAHLNLHRPAAEADLSSVGCDAHKEVAKEVAKRAITLVKNNQQGVLPLTSQKYKKILLIAHNSVNPFNSYISADKIKYHELLKSELEELGFEVEIYTPVLEQLSRASVSEVKQIMDKLYTSKSAVKDLKDRYDIVIQLANVPGNGVVQRLDFALTKGSIDMPWYVHELPVIFISVNCPFHLFDVPQVQTYINCYDSNEYTIKSLCKKLIGEEQFTGVSPVDAFCGTPDTRW